MKKIPPSLLILFIIIVTIPFLSWTNQPIVSGLYLFLTILAGGTWLIFNFRELKSLHCRINPVLCLILLLFIVLTTINLPMNIISALSPVRADHLSQANTTGPFLDFTSSFSYYYPGSRQYAIYGLALFILFFFAAGQMQSVKNLRSMLWIISLAGGIEAIYGIMQAVFPESGSLRLPNTSLPGTPPAGTFTDSSHFAAFLNMCWPISLAFGVAIFNRILEKIEILKIKKKNLALTDWLRFPFYPSLLPLWSTFFSLAAIILSRSTSGIIIMFILVVLCRMAIPYPRIVKIIFSGVIYTALLLYGVFLGVQGIISRSGSLMATVQGQWAVWSDSLIILKDHLYTGVGMGALPYLFPVYFPPHLTDMHLNNIRNDYVMLALETGLPAILFIFLWLLYGIVLYAREILAMPGKIEKMTQDQILIIGSYYAFIGILIVLATTSVIDTPSLAYYAALVVAVLYSIHNRKFVPGYSPEYIFAKKKPVSFVPYRKRPARRRRG